MSGEKKTRLTWAGGGRHHQGQEGSAGGVHLFTYTWDGSKAYPGEPWIMQTALPGHEGKRWRGGCEIGLQEKADRLLAAWLVKVVGLPPDQDAAFEAWNEREGYGHDMTEHMHHAFDAGWGARGGVTP